ncbi:hypothetical protein [Brevundimonas sp.]|uniref:hypothetical protein n=1 Tax=Brevundimonas sp. TaxID=1871086 RepID=UPI0027378D9D|nr:hypothetical protein [Brevundimonas sp.]MDP3803131.1 hypothetical protein [Brevundimonas sp.]
MFYYVGAIMVVGALFLLVVAVVAGQMTWFAAGIIAANVAGGSVMHLIGRWMIKRTNGPA